MSTCAHVFTTSFTDLLLAAATIALALFTGCGAGPKSPPQTGDDASVRTDVAAASTRGSHEHGQGHAHGHGHGHSAAGGPLVHRFESAEEWAKVFDDPARDAWQRPQDVVAAAKIAPGSTVVDLGAGTGYFMPHLARAVGKSGKVIALDIEPDMVRHLRERGARAGLTNVEAKVVPVDDPALPAHSVDRVLIVDTWHHIPGRPAYVRKLKEALTPGGAVVVVDFTADSPRGPPKNHRIAPQEVVTELLAGGFTAKIVDEPLPDQYIVVGELSP